MKPATNMPRPHSPASEQPNDTSPPAAKDGAADVGWRFDPSYQRLPASLYQRVDPVPVARARLLLLNRGLAAALGLNADALTTSDGTEILAGNHLPDEAQPIAQAYAGHQYGHFTILGDGRAVLLGEQLTPDNRRFDLQFKGSGPTPFSRRGDGRAALGPMLREYVISEAMHALGIPTTRCLSVVASGETVQRQTAQPGAVMLRVAASHIRIGTFEWAAAQRDRQALEALVRHTLDRHYGGRPDEPGPENEPPALRLLRLAVERLADLVARWMGIGFIHGVMNTDNIALSGETIDYGPCAFMDHHDPATVFSSIDHGGRYAYGNQPPIMQWNLARLAEALLPLIDPDEARAIDLAKKVLVSFAGHYQSAWLNVMRTKLGLSQTAEPEHHRALIERWLTILTEGRADFTNSLRLLSECQSPDDLAQDARRAALQAEWPGTGGCLNHPALQAWLTDWRHALNGADWPGIAESMKSANPAVIPRNHRVEQALVAAEQNDDLGPLHDLLKVLANPWQARVEHLDYRGPPRPEERVCETFCGT